MTNQEFKKVRSLKLDYADKPKDRIEWRGIIGTVAVIAAFLGLVALEFAVMGGVWPL